ncbi:MAG: hypothetical protein ACRCS3_01015 [Paracoccaceae bacterium]
MANGMFLGFAAVCTVVVGSLDYTMQTRRADLAFGELGVGAYVASFGERFAGMKAEQAAAAETAALRRQENRTLLPEAPEGWVMREWNEADRDRLWPPVDEEARLASLDPEFAEVERELMNNPMIANMKANADRQRIAAEKAEMRFYERGQSLIALRLNFDRVTTGVGLTGSVQEAGMDIIVGNMTAMSGRDGFAVIGGVTYGRHFGLMEFADPTVDVSTTVRAIRGQMGPELTINASVLASDDDVKDLLAQIDYDTLNKLLTTPLEGVGSNAPTITAAEEQAIADAAVRAEAAAVIARGRQSEENLRNMAVAMQEGGGAGVFGVLMQRSAAEREAANAAAEAAAAEPPKEGTLAALMAGAGAPAPAADAAPAPEAAAMPAQISLDGADAAPAATVPSTPATEVRVRRAGSTDGENCTMTATGKRCSLLGD